MDSSVWMEPYFVRVLWTTLLALKDSDHVVRLSAFKIASRANMSEQEVLDGLNILSAPDTKRLEPQPFDGRRIERVEEGWLVLNGEAYKKKAMELSRRIMKAKSEKERRLKGKVSSMTMAERNGDGDGGAESEERLEVRKEAREETERERLERLVNQKS